MAAATRLVLSTRVCVDAEAALKAIKSRYSRKLAHMTVCQGVHLGWVHELLYGPDHLKCGLTKVASAENLADIGTKRITDGSHFARLKHAIGVRPAA